MLQSLLETVVGSRQHTSSISSVDSSPSENFDSKNFPDGESQKNSIEVFSAQSAETVALCPKCSGATFWQPKFQPGVWKCTDCEPFPSQIMVEQIKRVDELGSSLPAIDPFIVCVSDAICDFCGSTWLEVSSFGYRCAHCNSIVKKSAEEIFFPSQEFTAKEICRYEELQQELDQAGSHRSFVGVINRLKDRLSKAYGDTTSQDDSEGRDE